MKDLLTKEHYCSKIHTLQTKEILASPPCSIDKPPIWITPPFLQKNLDRPFYDFPKNLPPPIKMGV